MDKVESPFKKDYAKSFTGYHENLEFFWNHCEDTFAHLKIDKWLGNESSIVDIWHSTFLHLYDFTDSTVVDYGIGGGYLGKALFTRYGIKKYIGLDIANRSLDTARRNIESLGEHELHLVPYDLKKTGADFFVSLACIQHFPNQSMLDELFENLEQSDIPNLILQIRYNPSTEFNSESPVFACRTNHTYIGEKLPSYELVMASPIENNSYQFLIFKSKNSAFPGRYIQKPPSELYLAKKQMGSLLLELEKRQKIIDDLLQSESYRIGHFLTKFGKYLMFKR